MMIWIALLRGINVGGHNVLPMADLRELVEQIGGEDVRTYIQSGNVVFDHSHADADRITATLTNAIFAQFGLRPELAVTTPTLLARIVDQTPSDFVNVIENKIYISIAIDGELDIAKLAEAASTASAGELFHYDRKAVYLAAPNGIARSQLAQRIARIMGENVTTRNLRTLRKVLALANECDGKRD